MKLITVILIIIAILIIYWIGRNVSKTQETEIEKFTALSGISNPLTSHDDYGTFNFIMQFDDLPYGTGYYEWLPIIKKLNENTINENNIVESLNGERVQKSIIPSNYSNIQANFNGEPLQFKPNNYAPHEANYYFGTFNDYFG